MHYSRILGYTLYKKNSSFVFSLVPSQHRWISSTTPLQNSWMDKIKGVFTGEKASDEGPQMTSKSFTLRRFADELKNARRVGSFKQYMVGRSSEATFSDAFEKQEAIIRYLGGFDATGEILMFCRISKAITSKKQQRIVIARLPMLRMLWPSLRGPKKHKRR